MSTTIEDIMYDDYLAEQAQLELEAAAIEEFRQENLKRYYIKNPGILKPAQKLNYDAYTLHRSNQTTASLILNFSAIEILIREIVVKPLVHGNIIDEETADLITAAIIDKMKNHNLYSILEKFVKTYAGIDIRNYKNKNLIKDFEELQVTRNAALHRGQVITIKESENAIKLSKIFYMLVSEFMTNIGLTIDREDWNIKQK